MKVKIKPFYNAMRKLQREGIDPRSVARPPLAIVPTYVKHEPRSEELAAWLASEDGAQMRRIIDAARQLVGKSGSVTMSGGSHHRDKADPIPSSSLYIFIDVNSRLTIRISWKWDRWAMRFSVALLEGQGERLLWWNSPPMPLMSETRAGHVSWAVEHPSIGWVTGERDWERGVYVPRVWGTREAEAAFKRARMEAQQRELPDGIGAAS
jgi:hypothetical protein